MWMFLVDGYTRKAALQNLVSSSSVCLNCMLNEQISYHLPAPAFGSLYKCF